MRFNAGTLPMLSLFLRNLFFTVIHPGLLAGLIPYWILGEQFKTPFTQDFQFYHYAGILLFTIGLVILFSCIIRFAVKGRGTLSPIDPTRRLVISGLYKYSRNPMYVGVMFILTGEAIFFRLGSLWWYALAVFIGFNLFILLHEEPRLRKDFGEEYKKYCQKVRRWI